MSALLLGLTYGDVTSQRSLPRNTGTEQRKLGHSFCYRLFNGKLCHLEGKLVTLKSPKW